MQKKHRSDQHLSFLLEWLLYSWPTSQNEDSDAKGDRADGKYTRKRTRRKKARQKGGLCTLDGVPALNVEGRGPYNDRAVSFLSSFPSLHWLSAASVPFCEHLPDRPDQMPKDRPVQARSLADNSIISDISSVQSAHRLPWVARMTAIPFI